MILGAPFNINDIYDIRLLIDFFFLLKVVLFSYLTCFFIINLKNFVCILKDVEIFFTLLKSYEVLKIQKYIMQKKKTKYFGYNGIITLYFI